MAASMADVFWRLVVVTSGLLSLLPGHVTGNVAGKKLYAELIENPRRNYNKEVRPVKREQDTVIVKIGLRLSQIVDLVSCTRLSAVPGIAGLSGPRLRAPPQKWVAWTLGLDGPPSTILDEISLKIQYVCQGGRSGLRLQVPPFFCQICRGGRSLGGRLGL